MASSSKGPTGESSWKIAVELVASVSVTAGFILYGVLTLAYEEFYRSIGLEPSDVGLTYVTTLARSSGLALWFALYAAFFICVWIYWRWWATLHRKPYRVAGRLVTMWIKTPVILISICTGIVLLATAVLLPIKAAMQAHQVQQGKPVSPVRLGPIVLLDTDVKYAKVEPVATDGGSGSSTSSGTSSSPHSPIGGLVGKTFLYIGRTDSTIVLFDSHSQAVIQVPASTIILRVNRAPS